MDGGVGGIVWWFDWMKGKEPGHVWWFDWMESKDGLLGGLIGWRVRRDCKGSYVLKGNGLL